MKRMKVRPVNGIRFPLVEAAAAIPPRLEFVGYDLVPGVDEDGNAQIEAVMRNSVQEVMFHKMYIKAIKDGDLLPADAATAELAGLKFQSSLNKDK